MSGDCGCERARRALEEYVHHELCSEDAADIRHHLETCPACRREHLVSVTLTEVLARACQETAPEQLRIEVLARIRTVQASHTGSAVSR